MKNAKDYIELLEMKNFKQSCIWFDSYFGEKEQTNNDAWDSSDLANMAEWYDGTIDAIIETYIPSEEA